MQRYINYIREHAVALLICALLASLAGNIYQRITRCDDTVISAAQHAQAAKILGPALREWPEYARWRDCKASPSRS